MSNVREKAKQMLEKEIDPIFNEVAGLIESHLKDSKYMPWIMERLMNKDQARILIALPDMDREESMGRLEVSEQFAKKLDMDMDTINKHIRYLYENGMLFPTRRGPQPPRSMGQWIDTQNHPAYMDKLGEEYYALIALFSDNERENRDESIAMRIESGQPAYSRIIPRWKSIENNPDMIPADDIRALIKAQDTFALLNCACRIRFPDRECGVPLKTCLVLGRTAAYNIDRGAAKPITLEEALDFVTNETVKYPTVHIGRRATPENFSGILCNCHYDCCGVMRPSMVTHTTRYGIKEFYAPSRFRATVDPENCVSCRVCVDERCQFGAAQMKFYPEYGEERAYIDEEICMGCGNCVETCPAGIHGMKVVEPPETLTDVKPRNIYGAGGQGF